MSRKTETWANCCCLFAIPFMMGAIFVVVLVALGVGQ